jgi:hypothetical protein
MFTGTTGKYYSEATINAIGSGIVNGLINEAQVGTAWGNKSAYRETGAIYDLSGTAVTSGSTFTTGDVIGIAVDIGAGTVQFYKNNVAQGATPSFSFTAGTPLAFAGRSNNGNADLAFNFGQRPFKYTPPSGFVALNTFNLPDSTIKKGNTVMDATLYTGNGSTQTVTNAAGFKPDFVWRKSRSNAYYHYLEDSVRGATKDLYSNVTDAEATNANSLTSFNSNGFSMGSDTGSNGNGATFVAWQWQAGQGTNTSNTSGTITSTVSVNATAGFSVVTWSGNSTSGATIGHGLGVAPKMFIVKVRNRDEGRVVGHTSIGWSNFLQLNNTNASASSAFPWNNTAPSSTLITLGSGSGTNGSTYNYVGYAWAEIAGFSKFGSYTGNGSNDGPFVYTGFRPKFLMIKSSSTVTNWDILDTSRNTYNLANEALFPASSSATQTGWNIDILSNGFKIKTLLSDLNNSGDTIIYMAFAENPFKNANAR